MYQPPACCARAAGQRWSAPDKGCTSSPSACIDQARIAERLGLDRTVMTHLIDDLEEAGLVERRPDRADPAPGRC